MSGTPSVERSALDLRNRLDGLSFARPVWCTYNPLDYAWGPHLQYLRRYATGRKRVLFLGMNPGPFGMVQTGIPFGQVAAVRDWLKITARINQPAEQHPKRKVEGFDCPRSEVSGARLWGLFSARYGTADRFFAGHTVLNYCPLAFVEKTGRNRTPEKLPAEERDAVFAACDQHLREVVRILRPEWVIGVGDFASRRAERTLDGAVEVGHILHPSPASPAANRDWAGQATQQLRDLGVWEATD